MSADLERIIRIVFQGDNETQKAFNEVNAALDNLEGGVRSVTGPLSDVADATLKAQAALATLASAGIAVVVKEAGTWSDSFQEIYTLIDDTDANVQKFKADLLEYSSSATFALDDVNKAVYDAISAGVEYTEVLDLMRVSEKLATAGKAELGSTTKALVSTLNAYGESTDEAARYSDILFTAVKEGQTTLPELADSLARVTSLAAPAGVSFEEVAAALATMTAQGMPTREAMTALRGAIQSILKPTSEASEYAEELGIEFDAAALKSKGFDGVLMDVWEATDGNTEAVSKLFSNVRGLTGVLATFGQDGGDAFRETLDNARTSAGATDDAFAKMADNVGEHTQSLVNALRAALITAGMPILDEFGTAAEGLSAIFDGVRVGIDEGAFDPLYDRLNDLIREVSSYAEQIGEALPEAMEALDWEQLLEGLENLGESVVELFGSLFQGLDPTDAEDLAEILQTLVDAMGNLANVSAGIVDEWRPVAEVAGKLFTEFSELNPVIAEMAGHLLGVAQKAELLWEKLGFLKGSLALIGTEMGASEESTSALGNAFDWVANPMGVAMGMTQDFVGWLGNLGGSARDAADDTDDLSRALEGIEAPEPTEIEIIYPDLTSFEALFGEIPDVKDVKVNVDDDGTIPDLHTQLSGIPMELWTLVNVNDEGTSDRTKDKIDDTIPAEKRLEIQAELEIAEIEKEIAKIESQADVLQSAIEWKAKLDIAGVEADARKLESIADTIGAAWEATGESISAAYSALDPEMSWKEWKSILRRIDEEMDQRDRLLDMQEDLVNTQVRYMEAKIDAMRDNEGLIQIDGAGLQPHLEAFMWEILEAIQIRVNEEGLDMLTGTPTAT